jgi:hypothetical protein
VQRGDLDALVRRPNAVLVGVLCMFGDLGGLEEGFGGDAAPVQAGSTDLVLLDEGDLQPEVCREQCG